MADNRVGSIVIDAKMDKRDFMTNSKDVARAISSLKSTVAQSGKEMKSSAAGYGTAMRQVVAASREANAQIREIDNTARGLKSQLDKLGQSKVATPALKETIKEIGNAEKALDRLRDRQTKMNEMGTGYSSEFQKVRSEAEQIAYQMNAQYAQMKKNADMARIMREEIKTGRDSQTGQKLGTDDIIARKDAINQLSQAQKQLAKGYKDNEAALNANIDEQQAMKDAGTWQSQQAKALEYDIKKQQEYIDKLKQTRDQMMQQDGVGYISGDKTQEYKEAASRYAEIMQMRQKAMAQMGEDFKPPYLKYFESLPRMTSMISEGFGRIQNVASGAAYALTHPFQTLDRALGTVISTVGRAVSAFAKMAGNAAVSFLKRLASEARNAAVQLAKLAANAVSSGLKKIATWAHAAAQGVLNFHKNNKRSNSGIGTSLKMILKYAFGIRSMYFLFRRLRRAVIDGFGELKKQNPEVKAAIDSLSKACNGLKGSLAAAFAPILTAIAPALTTLINMLTAALNTIGAFFAALTGKNTVAKSIGKIGSSAGKAGGKVKELKRELAGFDELNILNKNDGSGGGGGSGSGFAYENVPIESGIKDFVDRMKALWAAEDFEGIGKEIAGYINRGIDNIDQRISWDNVKDNVSKGVQAVVGIFNGLVNPVDGIDFDKLGKTVSDGVETILNAFALLLDPSTGIDFPSAGVALARALNGFLRNPLMWNMAAKVLSMSARAFIKFSEALLWEFNEGEVATNIRNAIAQPDLWKGIAKSTWDAIKLAFNKAGNFVNVLLGGKDYSNAWGDAERMMRARPANIIPDVSYNGMWDELATNLGTGIKKAITRFTEIVAKLPTDEALGAILDWLERVKDAALADGSIGEMFGTVFQKIFGGFAVAVARFNQNSQKNGDLLAKSLNKLIKTALPANSDSGPGKVFSDAVIGAFDFIAAFLKGFDAKDAADRLREEIGKIDWNGIAKSAWEAFKTAVEKLGNFLTVLFGGEVEVDAQNSVDAVEQMWKRGSKSQNRDTGGSGLTKAIGGAVSSALDMLDRWINGIDWDDLGTKIHDALAALPWDEWGQKLAQALKDLLDGLDDLVFSGLYGENYQENDAWRILHPGKAAKYDFEQKTSGSENASRIISERGYTPEKYMELQKLSNQDAAGADARGDTKLANAIFDAQQKMAELDHAIAVADAPGIVAQMRANDASYDEIAAAMLELGLTVEEGAAAINGNTVANESNTTAIDANTEVQPAQPETTQEDTDVVRDLLEYALDNVNKQPEQTEGKFDQMPVVHDEKLNDELDGLPDAVQLAIDVIKDGTMPGDVAELLNLTDESNKILQDYLDKHPELTGSSEKDNEPPIQKTFDLFTGKAFEGEPQHKGIIRTKGPAAKVKEKAQEAIAEHQNEVTTESTESTNKLSKVSGKLAKLLKGGITTEGTTEVTLKGDSVEALNGKSKVNVGVNFVPGDGDEGDDEAKNGGLLGWLQALLDADTLEAQIALVKDGWESVKAWLDIDDNTPFSVFIELLKEKWDNIREFLGIPENGIIDTIVKAVLNGWPGILKALGLPEDATVGAVVNALMADNFGGIKKLLGLPEDSTISAIIEALTKKGFKTFLELLGITSFDPTVSGNILQVLQNGWKTFLGLLGIDTTNPTVSSTIKQVTTGFKTFFSLLGINTLSPLVSAVVDILTGKITGDEAKAALLGAGKTLTSTVSVSIKKATQTVDNVVQFAIQLLAGGGKSKADGEVTVNTKKGKGDKSADGAVDSTQKGGTQGTVHVQAVHKAGDKIAEETVQADGTTKNVGIKAEVKDSGQDIRDRIQVKLNTTSGVGFEGYVSTSGEGLLSKAQEKVNSSNKTVNMAGAIASSGDDIISTAQWHVNQSGKTVNMAGAIASSGKDIVSTAQWHVNNDTTKTVNMAGAIASSGDDLVGTAQWHVNQSGKTVGMAGAIASSGKNIISTAQGNVDKTTQTVNMAGAIATGGKDIVGTAQWHVNNTTQTVNMAGAISTSGKGIVSTAQEKVKQTDKIVGMAGAISTSGKGIVDAVQEKVKQTDKTVGMAGAIATSGKGIVDTAQWHVDNTDKTVGMAGAIATSGKGIVDTAQWHVNNTTQTVNMAGAIASSGDDLVKSAQAKVNESKMTVKFKAEATGGTSAGTSYREPYEMGGIITASGRTLRFANGGRIMNSGRASWWDSVNKYAAGTSKAHGTVFVAGENGPEIMGHVNGRTEILNKSQLAEAIYGAIVSGMAKAVNALGSYLANHMSTCTNAIVSTIGATTQLNAVRGLNYYEPAMANGGIMPYDVSAQIARSTTALQGTLDANNEDLIQAMVSAIGSASMQIVAAIQAQMRAGGGSNITTQQVINEINRQGMMYGRTPIKGV